MLIKFFVYVFLGLVLVFGYVRYIESKSIFFPTRDFEFLPTDAGLNFEDIYIETSDNIKINGWFIPQAQAGKTLLFFHGNAGNISNRLAKILILRKLGVNIFIVDYRGYGKSQGKPTESGTYLDAKAAYNYLVNQRKINPADIVVYGESLGGAVAINLAAAEPVGSLIVEGTFSRGRDIGKILYPFLPKNILPNVFDSLSKINLIRIPKLFIHSQDDSIIPISLGRKLYDSSPDPKQFITLSGEHNSAFIDSESVSLKAISQFLKGEE